MYRAAEPAFCRKCGETWSPGGESCSSCGEPRDASPETTAPRPTYRPQGRRIRTLAILLAINAVVLGFDIAFDLIEWSLMREAMAGNILIDELAESDRHQLIVSSVHLVTFLATLVVFCTWLFDAGRNLRAFGVSDTRQTEEGRVVWFFVPVLNFVKPLLGMRELWRASAARGRERWQDVRPSFLVTAWWLVCVPAFSLMLAAWTLVLGEITTPPQLILADQIGITGALLRLLATPLLLAVVINIHRHQEVRAATDPLLRHDETAD